MAIFTELPLDIIHRILTTLPNFQSLGAAILSCKGVHRVFQAHPKAITTAVGTNIVGPAWCQALDLVAYREMYGWYTDAIETLTFQLKMACISTWDPCEDLVSNAGFVSGLQDLFSILYKDRKSPRSQLTNAESHRFYRASYHFWILYHWMIHHGYVDNAEPGSSDSEDKKLAIIIQCIDLYCREDQELFELDVIISFVEDTLHDTCDILTVNFVPRLNEFLYEHGSYMDEKLLADAMNKVYDIRGISAERRESELPRAVLDEVIDEHDKCHRCQVIRGPWLWSQSNFLLFPGCLSADSWERAIDVLPHGSDEAIALRDYLTTSMHEVNIDWSDLFVSLCDRPTDTTSVWEKDQWYCTDCIKVLFRERLGQYWTEQAYPALQLANAVSQALLAD